MITFNIFYYKNMRTVKCGHFTTFYYNKIVLEFSWTMKSIVVAV